MTFSLSYGQINGTFTIGSDPYPSIASAISALNASGTTTGVTFNVPAGYTETFLSPTAGLITTNSGSASSPIVFQKSGSGTNPLITAGIGTTTTNDAIICIAGTDFITFDGIDLAESAGNTSTTTQMEWGYALVKGNAVSPFNGCQYVTIKNCSITLNKTNTASTGIYSGNHIATATTALTIAVATDAMNNCKFFNNTISNVYTGINLNGYNDNNSSYALYDQNNEVGTEGANTITNFGGSNVAAYGIYSIYQNGLKVANNNINGGTSTSATLYGIFLSTGTSSNVDIYNNTVTITGGGTTSAIYGISNAMGATAASNKVNIYSNTVQNCTYPTATSGKFYGIINSASADTVKIYSNTVTGNSIKTTGDFTGIDAGNANNIRYYNNNVFNNTKTGTGSMYCMRAATAKIILHDNNIYSNNINTTGSTSSSCTLYGYFNFGSPTVETHYNNQIYDLNITGTTSSTSNTIYCMMTNTTATDVKNWYSNIIRNISISTGSGTIYGINSSLGTPANIYKNQVYNLSSSGTSGKVYGINIGSGATVNVYNNFVSDLKTPASTQTDAIRGIYLSGGTTINCEYNTVFLNATSTSTSTFGTTGIYTSTSPTIDLRNNNIINISTPVGAAYTVAHRHSGTATTGLSSTTGNNNYYAGTPNTYHLIYYDGTTGYQTISTYKTAISPKEANSISENPPFINTTTTPYNLHLATGTPTFLESGGSQITSPSITNDIDGDVRWGETGYTGSGNAPDIGADEGEFTPPSLTPPTNFTAAPFSSTQINLTFTPTGTPLNNVIIVWNTTNSFTSPSGTPPEIGQSFAGGTLLYNGTTSPVSHTELTAGTTYYYSAWSKDATDNYSTATIAQAIPIVPSPAAFSATAVSASEIDLAWTKNAANHNVIVAVNSTSTFGSPVNGTTYATGDPITGGGSIIYTGPLSSFNHTGLTSNTTYYYKIWSVDAVTYYSTGVAANASTPCEAVSVFPYTASFSATMQDCWTASEGVSGASYHWTPTTVDGTHGVNGPQSGTHFMFLNVYSASTTYNPYYLTTISFDLGATPKQIKYYYFLGADGYTSSPIPLTLQISDNNGITWTDLYQHTTSNSTFSSTNAISGWTQNTVNLTSYANKTVIFRFKSNSNYGQNICNQGIDEVVVEDLPTNPIFSITPTSKDYKVINIGSISPVQTFTISNIGSGTLIINSGNISLTGTNPTDFTLTDNNVYPIQLTNGQTATISVAFSPLTGGIKNANLHFVDNISKATHDVTLTGTAPELPAVLPLTQDFESGFGSWTVVNDNQDNAWYVGTATAHNSNQSAYISQDNGVTNTYNHSSSSVVHFFRDITFPAGKTLITLAFDWKSNGEHSTSNDYDFMKVSLVDISTIPAAGTSLASGQIGIIYNNISYWQTANFRLPENLAGTTKRLVFSWENDNSDGSDPPAAIDNILFTADYAPTTTIWTGTTNNDWNTGTNWDVNIVPLSTTDVTIPATTSNYPTLSTAGTCHNLTMEPGTSLLGNANLTVTGIANVQLTIEGALAGNNDKWHLISQPVASIAQASNVFNHCYLKQYNETTNLYEDVAGTTPLNTVGKGYSTMYSYQNGAPTTKTLEFTGSLNDGAYSIPLSFTSGMGEGWNLVGNPYPSVINWNAASGWTKPANMNNSIYFWDNTLNDGAGNYKYYLGSGGSNEGVGVSGGSQYIPALQGFFVKTAAACTLGMNNNVRIHYHVPFYKDGITTPLIRLQVVNGSYSDETVVRFDANATSGADNAYDCWKLFASNVPQLSTITTDNVNMAINTFPQVESDLIVPLQLNAGVTGNFTIRATEILNFNDSPVMLEDKILNITQNLTQNPTYSFTASIGDNPDRFNLHFKSVNGINDPSENKVNIYSCGKTVYINPGTVNLHGQVVIYDILGKPIVTKQLEGTSLYCLHLNITPGCYIVKVITDNNVYSQKVVIK